MAEKTIQKSSETPLMKQYNEIKSKHPDAILFFRVGDFYETFGSDAVTTSKTLGITLTKRANGAASEIALAGFPHHALDNYLPRMVKAGFRVAICDQLEDPKLTKTVVKRGITELITPGTAMGDLLLDQKSNNFLAGIYPAKSTVGLSLLDISTGEFQVTEGDLDTISKLLIRYKVSELICPKSSADLCKNHSSLAPLLYPVDDWMFAQDNNRQLLLDHFQTVSLKGFGVDHLHAAITAAGALFQYLKSTEHHRWNHIHKISAIHSEHFMGLDAFTIRNLELVESQHPEGISLFSVLDHTQTAMGARLLKRNLLFPLTDIDSIQQRHLAVSNLIQNSEPSSTLRNELNRIGDLERLCARFSTHKVQPRECIHLLHCLLAIPLIKDVLKTLNADLLLAAENDLQPAHDLALRLSKEIHPDAPAVLHKSPTFKEGFHPELDEYRGLIKNSRQYLLELQIREAQKSGIQSLKVGFNNVFGYYLEVTNTHKSKVPAEWIRKQTLANAERYITPELKELEEKILQAESQVQRIEEDLFKNILLAIQSALPVLMKNAEVLSLLDVLLCFAYTAENFEYACPVINDSHTLQITGGRHPVIERGMPASSPYVPNDILLNEEDQQILMITGPNMSGKSAVLRQTALIVLMAQCGSFVPAESAEIGVVDRLFTRVGASDNLSSGESTFMVEMNETAGIMNNITPRCLVLLDEIGRGTATYDGISIAWALAEYLHEYPNARPKTLFATHYHELNELSERFPRIKNFHIATKESGKNILFLRKLVPGGSEHSFGIHVARLAGMPFALIQRAEEILLSLEEKAGSMKERRLQRKSLPSTQLNMFAAEDPRQSLICNTIKELDINSLTPVDALWKLHELKKQLGN